mmetsp:Transcript_100323/g.321698  ORF Transcript_100323/g.321698 Transcript_100323/m.321698 type:complete len:404 (+) Transcript_100323:96-1307(+)
MGAALNSVADGRLSGLCDKYKELLAGEAPCIVGAPMVRGSELAFRMLLRRRGVRICYTPMIKADHLVAGGADEWSVLESCEEDRPLVAQLAGRDPAILAAAARLVLDNLAVDALDLNLGCPQECAQEGGYGAFLQEEPELAAACVEAMCRVATTVPVFCKIRVLGNPEATVAYARRLEAAGCSLLTVHCRTREAKHRGEPDFEHLARVAAAVNIPVVANGGIGSLEEAADAIRRSGAVAAMAATSLLRCPRAFAREDHNGCEGQWNPAELAWEYLHFAGKYPPPSPLYVRKHLRWIFRELLQPAHVEAYQGWLQGINTDEADWRARAWTFLEQPYLKELWQFRALVQLVAHHNQWLVGLEAGQECSPLLSFREIRVGAECEKLAEEEPSVEWLFAEDGLVGGC